MSDLKNHGANPDTDEDRVPLQSLYDVALFMNLASINFIEEGHHDKGVEDDSEVLVGKSVQFLGIFYPVIDAKQFRTCTNHPCMTGSYSSLFCQTTKYMTAYQLAKCVHPTVIYSIIKT